MPKAPRVVRDASLPVAAPEAASSAVDAAVADASVDDEPHGEAGTSACRLAYGPAEQPFRGPAALEVTATEVRMIANEGGRPHVFSVPIPPKKAPYTDPPTPSSSIGVRWPPCELAGKFVYCPQPGGGIVRSTIESTGVVGTPKPVPGVNVRSGTRIAAALLDPDHSVVGWLDTRTTSEGDMLQAFVALDTNNGVRLSEEGAGATALRFIQRKEGAVALYLDVRTSMVPVHARPMAFKENALTLAPDVVLSIGGVPERGIDFTVAMIGTRGFAFVPMPKDTLEFGMATFPIDDPPKDNITPAWSLYPNGLDPAPIAAAATREGKGAWVVRTRPREKAASSPRILELGKVDPSGSFTSLGEIGPAKNVTDIVAVEDTASSVWILYSDATVTWLERRVCD